MEKTRWGLRIVVMLLVAALVGLITWHFVSRNVPPPSAGGSDAVQDGELWTGEDTPKDGQGTDEPLDDEAARPLEPGEMAVPMEGETLGPTAEGDFFRYHGMKLTFPAGVSWYAIEDSLYFDWDYDEYISLNYYEDLGGENGLADYSEEELRELAESWAEEDGSQVWAERVRVAGLVGVRITTLEESEAGRELWTWYTLEMDGDILEIWATCALGDDETVEKGDQGPALPGAIQKVLENIELEGRDQGL
ncbi:hypothetical protein [Gehongia tenuis]|uniref:Uncharacterized protein n=1 Tax=Gehongia tenuis TaxID=2763655 RepID=A0A926D555_9FIRM|nr:hypothetical protein [Gehongia tenuis]MBC8530550.1 hypothetical protein [Gehongia tenuis]